MLDPSDRGMEFSMKFHVLMLKKVEIEPPEISEFVQTTRDTCISISPDGDVSKSSAESGEDLPLKMGEILLVLGEEDDQMKVDWDGLIGLVPKDAVKKMQNVPGNFHEFFLCNPL